MSTRQYIGARYVPKFFENPNGSAEWIKEKTYEALTIVTYLGDSYTSRKNVPINIDISNTDYWVLTGNFNAQLNGVSTKLKNTDYFFDTVNDILVAKNRIQNTIISTKGFNRVNDGGGASYIVVDKGNMTPNGMDIIDLGDKVACLLITEPILTPEKFGAYGDGVHDDTKAINRMYDYCNDIFYRTVPGDIEPIISNSYKVIMSKWYGVSKSNTDANGVTSCVNVKCNTEMTSNSKLIALGAVDYVVRIGGEYRDFCIGLNVNLFVDCNKRATNGVDIRYCRRCLINVWVSNFIDTGVYNGTILSGNDENVFNVFAYGIKNANINSKCGFKIHSGDSVYQNIVAQNCITGVYVDTLFNCETLHTWIDKDALYNDSVTLETSNQPGINFNVCNIGTLYIDTTKTGIKGKSSFVYIDTIAQLLNTSIFGSVSSSPILTVKSLGVDNNTKLKVAVENIRCLDNSGNIVPTFEGDNQWFEFKIGSIVGDISIKFDDINNLPSDGLFSVGPITSPVSASLVNVVCESSNRFRKQTIYYGGEIYYRVWDYTSQQNFGIWRKINITTV